MQWLTPWGSGLWWESVDVIGTGIRTRWGKIIYYPDQGDKRSKILVSVEAMFLRGRVLSSTNKLMLLKNILHLFSSSLFPQESKFFIILLFAFYFSWIFCRHTHNNVWKTHNLKSLLTKISETWPIHSWQLQLSWCSSVIEYWLSRFLSRLIFIKMVAQKFRPKQF